MITPLKTTSRNIYDRLSKLIFFYYFRRETVWEVSPLSFHVSTKTMM